MRIDLDALMSRLGAADTPRTRAVVFGDPVPKARPRVMKGYSYTPPKTREAEKTIAWHLKALGITVIEGPAVLAAVFYRRTRQRVDVDNLLKTVLDAATTAGAWKDDSQVAAITGIIEYDPEKPRTEFQFGPRVDAGRKAA